MFSVQQDSQQMYKQILNVLSKPRRWQGMALSLALPFSASLSLLWLVGSPAAASDAFVSDKTVAVSHPTGKQSTRRRIPRPAPPQRRPQPRNRVQPGGGLDVAAQACLPESAPLTALVPVENPVFTMRDRPTFLFYLSDAPEAVDYAEFILLSGDEKEEIYSIQFAPTASGIVSVSLPADSEQVLVPGEAYHWYLNLHCATAAGVPSVNGWVERLAADAAVDTAIDSVLPEVWYDAIAQMAESLRQAPFEPVLSDQTLFEQAALDSDDVRTQWNGVLTAAGLDVLIDVPVLGPILQVEVAVSPVSD